MLPIHVTVAHRRLVAVVLLLVVGAVFFLRHRSPSEPAPAGPLQVAPIAVKPARASPSAARMVVVDVVGAVRRPGVYRLPQGSRVDDAVARAGGLTRTAQRIAVNLAAPLADGEQVLVAGRGVSGGASAADPQPGGAPAAPVSLSTATAEQLDALPGVGPVTAQKIVAYRQQHGPFTSVEGLDAISGIGPAKIADLKGLVEP